MPFVYYGGKKALARYYPAPGCKTIVEPFAGSAGYSLHWAKPGVRVVLVEKEPKIARLWRRLQADGAAEEIAAIRCPPVGERSAEPLLSLTAGGVGGLGGALSARPFQVTTRMHRDWPAQRARIVTALPLIRDWQLIEGDYTQAPDIRATWFIDPPYQVMLGEDGTRGDGYRHGASAIDFAALADWCKSRQGQTSI